MKKSKKLESKEILTIYIDISIKTKEELIKLYALQAQFPDYFSLNWDSFEEYMHNLSWIKQREIVINHNTLPLDESTEDFKTYIEILKDLIEYWRIDGFKKFEVIFPQNNKKKIETILNKK